MGGAVLTLWILVEIVGNWGDFKGSESPGVSPTMIILAGAGYSILLLSLSMLLVSSSILEHVWNRGDISDEVQGHGRLELWKAMLRAITENPWFGLGLAGTEPARCRLCVFAVGKAVS